MSNELYEKTKRLLKQLNYFILHVILYFIFNIALVLTAFSNIQGRWWIFCPVLFWALVLIYHGLRVYGFDPLNRKNRKLNLIWSWVIKVTSV